MNTKAGKLAETRAALVALMIDLLAQNQTGFDRVKTYEALTHLIRAVAKMDDAISALERIRR
jgi:hypothetical protein